MLVLAGVISLAFIRRSYARTKRRHRMFGTTPRHAIAAICCDIGQLFRLNGVAHNGTETERAYCMRAAEKLGFREELAWLYETGNCGTIYTQYYDSQVLNDEQDQEYFPHGTVGYYDNRNNLRLNPTHRLDLSFNWHRKFSERVNRTLNLSIYNAYNRRNPFLVYVYTDSYYNGNEVIEDRKLRQLTLFPILPTISYAISF